MNQQFYAGFLRWLLRLAVFKKKPFGTFNFMPSASFFQPQHHLFHISVFPSLSLMNHRWKKTPLCPSYSPGTLLWARCGLGEGAALTVSVSSCALYIIHFFLIYLFLILIRSLLLYNIVVAFAIHWHKSAMGVHVSSSWTPSHLPPHPTPLGHPSAPALSTLSHASNLDWWSISYMIIYMFQCCSLRSSHPRLLPQSPTVCSLYLCLFCCLRYKVIITIFLNSIYMR